MWRSGHGSRSHPPIRSAEREGRQLPVHLPQADDVEKRADRKIVALLVSAGVDIDQGAGEIDGGQLLFDEDDAEDPRGPLPQGPPFSIDDVIEFHYLLEDDRYIAEFVASSGGN